MVCVHRCVFFICVHVWRGVPCKHLSADRVFLVVQMSIHPFVGFADGASRSTRNLSSAAWVIYDPAGEVVNLQGVCLGRTTNNIAEYSAVLELLIEAVNLIARVSRFAACSVTAEQTLFGKKLVHFTSVSTYSITGKEF